MRVFIASPFFSEEQVNRVQRLEQSLIRIRMCQKSSPHDFINSDILNLDQRMKGEGIPQ